MADNANPTFSICIPNYNYGNYIGDTIQSVLDQTYPYFEIIVVDNASTDNSVEVVKSFHDDRIRLYQNRYNVGFGPNLQRATMAAKNDFINLLSSDDQMKPRALEVYAQTLNSLGSDGKNAVLYSQVEVFTNTGAVSGIVRKAHNGFYNETIVGPPDSDSADGTEPAYVVYQGRDVLKDSLSRLQSFSPFQSLIYARSLWEAVEGYSGVRTMGPDKHFNYKLLSLDPKVIYIPRVLFRYRDYASDNRAVYYSTLRQLMDDYLYTLDFSEDQLKALGISKSQFIRTFLDQVCLKRGLSQLGQRNYSNALKAWAFALASYPAEAVRLPKMYLLLSLLALGPFSGLVSSLLYKGVRRIRPQHTADGARFAERTM